MVKFNFKCRGGRLTFPSANYEHYGKYIMEYVLMPLIITNGNLMMFFRNCIVLLAHMYNLYLYFLCSLFLLRVMFREYCYEENLMVQYKPQNLTDYLNLSRYGEGLTPSDFTVKPRIDVIKVTIPFEELPSNQVVNYFKMHGFTAKYKRNNFLVMNLSKIINCITFKMFCIINKTYYRTILIISQPNIQELKYLSQILNAFNYSVSEVEYALDIYDCDNAKLFGFLSSHAMLKYAGKLFHKAYETTQYLNSIRHTQTYGCKVYIKNKNNEEFVRIEMTVKKRALMKLHIHSIDDVMKYKAKIIFNRLQFKSLKYNSFIKNNKTVNNPSHILLDKMFKLMNTDKFCSGIVCVKEFMKQSIGNTYYYLDKHEFEDMFKKVIGEMTYGK